jgi:hypothetical protein
MDGEPMKLRPYPTANNRYAFVIEWLVVYLVLTIARHLVGHVRFPFADTVLAELPILWSVGVWMVYRSRFTSTTGEPIATPAANRYAFVVGSCVVYALLWTAEFQSVHGGFLFPGVVWIMFVMYEYPGRRLRTVSTRELFTGVAAIAAIGLALAVAASRLLAIAGYEPQPGFLLEFPWLTLLVVAYGAFQGGLALLLDWALRKWPGTHPREAVVNVTTPLPS